MCGLIFYFLTKDGDYCQGVISAPISRRQLYARLNQEIHANIRERAKQLLTNKQTHVYLARPPLNNIHSSYEH